MVWSLLNGLKFKNRFNPLTRPKKSQHQLSKYDHFLRIIIIGNCSFQVIWSAQGDKTICLADKRAPGKQDSQNKHKDFLA